MHAWTVVLMGVGYQPRVARVPQTYHRTQYLSTWISVPTVTVARWRTVAAYHHAMPDIDFAFLADAAETVPGQKFHVLGGGIARIGGRKFPLRHPHLALVIGLQVTAPETEREHDIRFVLLDPDGGEVAGATGSLVARSQRDGRDAILTFSIDLWNLTFPAPGDYSFRILVNGSERKRLPLLLLAPPDGATGTDANVASSVDG